MNRTSVLLVGVGGQGVVTAAEILAEALHASNVPVVTGQLHGLSQRAGSVECTVLLGSGESSWLPAGPVDVLVALEPLEALRAIGRVGPKTHVLVNRDPWVPINAVQQDVPYPPVDQILARLRSACRALHVLSARNLAQQAGDDRALNVLMLGALDGLVARGDAGMPPLAGLETGALARAAQTHGDVRRHEANRRAFLLGRQAMRVSREEQIHV